MKVFRTHNACGMFNAFITRLVYGGDTIIWTWTQNEAKAYIFETEQDANDALSALRSDLDCYTYLIN